jgi:hypothetical protein
MAKTHTSLNLGPDPLGAAGGALGTTRATDTCTSLCAMS